MTDELDELLWQMWLDEHGEEDFDEHKTKIKQAIQALIDRECNKARIDELEHIISGSEHSDDDFDWYELTKKEYVGTKYYSEVRHLDKDSRIAQLKGGAQE